jgi:rhombotail lipoprotein
MYQSKNTVRTKKFYLWFFVFVVFSGLLAACAIGSSRTYSSVVEYLYPGKAEPVEKASIPALALPLKVGIAFVPELAPMRTGAPTFGKAPARVSPITEQEKMVLMKEISEDFTKYPFVKQPIELIPGQYLSPGGSFTNLDQIRTMYGVDVIALISYDQVQFTDEGFLSMTYWTLVGAYVVKGEKNATSTMMDAAVYHIASRKMLFRAPGISAVKSSATPVNLSEKLREDAHLGFKDASKDLVKNLQTQLQAFQERVKTSPEEFKVVHSPGYRGGGSLDILTTILLSGMGGYALWSSRKRKK